MHIVLDCRSIHRHMAGIGRAALEIARAMIARSRGHRVTIILGSNLPDNLSLPGAEHLQVEAAMIDERFEQLHLPRVLEQLRADLYLNPTFSIPAIKTTPVQVAMIHDIVFEDRPDWVEPRLCGYLKRWSRFSATMADHIITDSDYSLARIRKVYGVSGNRLSRIYAGIAAECFSQPPRDALERVKRKFELASPYILYLGTLEPKKGTPELIRAFGRLADSGFTGGLVLAGAKCGADFDLDRELDQSGHRNRIRCLGYIDEADKKPLLRAARLFAYPSHYEGFGLPPLEAMALGIPSVVSMETCLPEVTGGNALTSPVGDSAELSKVLDRGINDEIYRARAAQAGPEHARKFTWERSASEILALCERLRAA